MHFECMFVNLVTLFTGILSKHSDLNGFEGLEGISLRRQESLRISWLILYCILTLLKHCVHNAAHSYFSHVSLLHLETMILFLVVTSFWYSALLALWWRRWALLPYKLLHCSTHNALLSHCNFDHTYRLYQLIQLIIAIQWKIWTEKGHQPFFSPYGSLITKICTSIKQVQYFLQIVISTLIQLNYLCSKAVIVI